MIATPLPAPQEVSLSRAQTLALLSELLAGFANDDFQHQLQELARSVAQKGSDLRCIDGRQALTLDVQRRVLPRYGFSGDEDGVLAMKKAIRKHMGDPRVAKKSLDIRDKLLIPEACTRVPGTTAAVMLETNEVSPTSAPPPQVVPGHDVLDRSSPCQTPAHASVIDPVKACESEIKKKDLELEVMVQHARGQGQLTVKVLAGNATMLQVKEAVVEALGRGSVADVQLVMWGGGMFVNHRDCDMVMTDRVFSTGLDLRGAN